MTPPQLLSNSVRIDPSLAQLAAGRGPDPELPRPFVPDEQRTASGGLGLFGGLVDSENRILGQRLDLVAAGASLEYWSDRVPGRRAAHQLEIPLTGATVSPRFLRIDLLVEVEGRRLERSFAPAAELSTTVDWSDLGAQELSSSEPTDWTVELGYVYAAEFGEALTTDRSFARPFGRRVDSFPSRGEVRHVRVDRGAFTAFHAADAFGFGGWGLSVLHKYDPLAKTLYYGTGSRQAWGGGPDTTEVLVRVAGTGSPGEEGDGELAREASLFDPTGLWPTRDGGLLIADTHNRRIRQVDRYGIIRTVAGTDCSDPSPAAMGDGGPADAARLYYPSKAVEGADGTIYIADAGHRVVRKVAPESKIISTFFDARSEKCDGKLSDLGMDAGGNLYVTVGDFWTWPMGTDDICSGIWRVAPDGDSTQLIDYLDPYRPEYSAHIPAVAALSVRPDGELAYIQWNWLNEIHATGVGPANRYDRALPGTGAGYPRFYVKSKDFPYFFGDGAPAATYYTKFFGPSGIALAADKTTYVADTLNQRIRVVRPDRMVETLVGGGSAALHHDGQRAKSVALSGPVGVALSPDGSSLYFSDTPSHTVWKMELAAPREGEEYEIPSEDGAAIFVFDLEANHLRTEDGLSRQTLWSFTYQSYPAAAPNGRPRKLVTEITDAFANTIRVERNGSGEATAIVAPFGQRTELTVDAEGYLASVSRPGSVGIEEIVLTSGPDGLLESLRDPNGGLYAYQWDELGRLARVDDPGSGSLVLATASKSEDGREIAATSAMGRSGATKVDFLPQREQRFTSRDSVDLESSVLARKDGSFASTSPLGVTATATTAPDAELGGLVTNWLSTTTTVPGGHLVSSSRSPQSLNLRPPPPRTEMREYPEVAAQRDRGSCGLLRSRFRDRRPMEPAGAAENAKKRVSRSSLENAARFPQAPQADYDETESTRGGKLNRHKRGKLGSQLTLSRAFPLFFGEPASRCAGSTLATKRCRASRSSSRERRSAERTLAALYLDSVARVDSSRFASYAQQTF